MTVQEAIERLVQKLCHEKEPHKFCSDACMYGEEHCEVQVAEMCMEKQIPKKVLHRKQYYGSPWMCPMCEAELIKVEFMKADGTEPNEMYSYCWHCGQKIDWEEGGTSD